MSMIVRGVTPLLEVFDMRRAIAFYRDVLGFDVVQAWEPDGHLYWAMLRLGGAAIMLNARYEDDQRPQSPDVARTAGHEDTELYFSCEDIDAVHAQLGMKGCPLAEPQATRYGMRQLWLTDPDGFKLCFQQPVDARQI